MLVTLFGIVTEVRPLQPEKASSPMLVTSPPIMILSILPFQLNQLPISLQCNSIDFNPRQASKASSPMFVTLFGIVTEVRLLHS